jgi:hypothetical protein
MGIREDLLAQITDLQGKVAILDSAPEDIYTLNTVVLFDAANGSKWYYRKTDEESWVNVKGGIVRNLAYWIYLATQSNVGYFEVYVLTPEEVPIFASS